MTDEIIPGIKLCQECRFFLSHTEQCGHRLAFSPDYVRGEHKRKSAFIMRINELTNYCGPDAQYFEPRRIDNVIGAAERFAQPCDVEAAE